MQENAFVKRNLGIPTRLIISTLSFACFLLSCSDVYFYWDLTQETAEYMH